MNRRDHVCLWDTLLPPSKAMICCGYMKDKKKEENTNILCYSALPGHESGAYAISYEPESQLLFSGGKRGEIGKTMILGYELCLILPLSQKVVSDLRQRTTMHTFTAHQSRIRSVAIDTENKMLITGSVDGELKVKKK